MRRARTACGPGAPAREGLGLMTGGLCLGLAALVPRLEVERSAIDAIARASRLRAVGEHMTKMRLAFGAADLSAAHEERAVLVCAYRVFVRRGIEARPSGPGIVLGV